MNGLDQIVDLAADYLGVMTSIGTSMTMGIITYKSMLDHEKWKVSYKEILEKLDQLEYWLQSEERRYQHFHGRL